MSVHFRVCHHPSKAEARATDVVVHDSGTSEDPWTGTWHRRGKGGADHRMVILRNGNQQTVPTGHLTRGHGTCAQRRGAGAGGGGVVP